MGKAKDILLKPIDSKTANEFVKRVHYSGKVVQNSQIHIGVYWYGNLEGVFQFGPPMNRRKVIHLVKGTKWNEVIELNRLAFTDVLPRNSESRAISIAVKLLNKHAPQLKWIISFADGVQCGDGTIYRASGFILTGIKPNETIWFMPDGSPVCEITYGKQQYALLNKGSANGGKFLSEHGATKGAGFMLRYIYFLDPSYRERLTVSELPYSEIERVGAGMYKGSKRGRGEIDSAPQTNEEIGGASPTRPLLQKS